MGSITCVEKILLISSCKAMEKGIKECCCLLTAKIDVRFFYRGYYAFLGFKYSASTSPSSSSNGFFF